MSHTTKTDDLSVSEQGLRSGFLDFLNRACFIAAESPRRWALAGTGKFDLQQVILLFGELAPTHFQFQVSDGHVAVRVFEDVLLVGVSQLTEASWSTVYSTYQASHEAALREIAWAASIALEAAETKGAADASALH